MEKSWGQGEENRTVNSIYISIAHQAMLGDIELIADYPVLCCWTSKLAPLLSYK